MPAPQIRPAASPRKTRRTRRGWSLLIIDNEPLRQGALSEYLSIEEKLGAVREQIEAFRSGDLPAYERWEASVFGALLTQLRETNLAVQEKRQFLEEIEAEMVWSGCSEITAYRRVKEARENPEAARAARERFEEPPEEEKGGSDFGGPDFHVFPPGFDVDEFEAAPKAVQRDLRETVEAMAELFSMMTGMPAPSFESLLERERAKKREAASREGAPPPRDFGPEPASPDARLKDLYRRLVRLLHPDSSGDDSPRARELWHELQEAYRTRDLEGMEAVAGRADLGMHGTAAALSVGLLRRMIRDLRDALSGMRAQVARARKDPAWNFRKRAKLLPKLEATRRKTLEHGLEQANFMLEELTRELARFEKRAARRAPKKTKPKPQKQKPRPARGKGGQFDFF